MLSLTGQELEWLLNGYDLRHWKPRKSLTYKSVLYFYRQPKPYRRGAIR